MKIPEAIQLIGHRIIVNKQETVDLDGDPCFGIAIYNSDAILIARNIDGVEVCESVEAETFLHELIHHISNAGAISLKENQVMFLARCLLTVTRENSIDWLDKTRDISDTKTDEELCQKNIQNIT
jgi:hypothetical protein